MALADYLHSYLGSLATDLSWSVAGGSYSFPVTDTLEAYGVDTEGEATDSVKLHAIGKVKVLEAVGRATASSIDYTADSSSFKMSQLHTQAMEMLASAKTEAMAYLPEYAIEVGEMTFEAGPYQRLESLYSGEAGLFEIEYREE